MRLLGDGGKSGKFGSGIVQMPADGSGAKTFVMGADVATQSVERDANIRFCRLGVRRNVMLKSIRKQT